MDASEIKSALLNALPYYESNDKDDYHYLVKESDIAWAVESLLKVFKSAKSKREYELEELLRSAHAIALRKGKETAWKRFATSIQNVGIGSVTARTYRVLEGDEEISG